MYDNVNHDAIRAAQQERHTILSRIQVTRAELEARWEKDQLDEDEQFVLARLRELDWAPE